MNKNNQIKFIQNSGGSDISNYSPKLLNKRNDKDIIVEQILKSNTKAQRRVFSVHLSTIAPKTYYSFGYNEFGTFANPS